MELKYRGITYKPSNLNGEATETHHVATFLGAKFHRKQYEVACHVPQSENLTFLGRRYTH